MSVIAFSVDVQRHYENLWDRTQDRRVRDENGCLIWIGATAPAGYGSVYDSITKQQVTTHRLAIYVTTGPIPVGMQTDHLCRVRPCCERTHLEVVTPSVNQQRRIDYPERCRRGHSFDGSKKHGQYTVRRCLECTRIESREYGARPWVCPDCGKAIRLGNSLRHLKAIHGYGTR